MTKFFVVFGQNNSQDWLYAQSADMRNNLIPKNNVKLSFQSDPYPKDALLFRMW